MFKKSKVIIAITAFITVIAQLWFANTARADLNNINFDFMAAKPSTYDHATGGGAWNAGQIGTNIVNELEGESFACNDHVSYLTKISAPAGSVNAANAVVALDFISTFAFAWVGARVAATKNMDYGGILFVAAVSAFFKSGADSPIAALVSGLLIVLLRLLSVKLKINLPKVK